MSREAWKQHIAKPSDNSGGKTNITTCGIVVNEVKSQFGKSGRGYAILSLGELNHGRSTTVSSSSKAASNEVRECITIFLFGEALSMLQSSTKPYLGRGYAVGITSPNLLPSKPNASTSITLSVSEKKHIVLLGKAADCDRCGGTVKRRVKTEYGVKFEEVRCGTLVDVRGGRYCGTHRRLGLSHGGEGGKSGVKNGGLTFLQRQREEFGGNRTMGASSVVKKEAIHIHRDATSRVSEALSQAGFLGSQSTSIAVNSSTSNNTIKRAPLHMKKSTNPVWSNTNTPLSTLNSSKLKRENPYKVNKPLKKSAEDILGQALQRKRLKTNGLSQASDNSKSTNKSSSNKPIKVFHTEGYDGSVPVPKPNPLFKTVKSIPQRSAQPANSGINAANILEKQKNIAFLIQEQKNSKNISSKSNLYIKKPPNKSKPQNKSAIQSDDPFATIFGNNTSTSTLDREAILSAKSRFDSAANAQEYARARSIVQQLEVREATKDTKKKDVPKAIVTTLWVCSTCRSKTPREPHGCIRKGHDVRQRRQLKEKKVEVGTRKERMERHGKEDAEGGLTLGSGLEWSGWRGMS